MSRNSTETYFQARVKYLTAIGRMDLLKAKRVAE